MLTSMLLSGSKLKLIYNTLCIWSTDSKSDTDQSGPNFFAFYEPSRHKHASSHPTGFQYAEELYLPVDGPSSRETLAQLSTRKSTPVVSKFSETRPKAVETGHQVLLIPRNSLFVQYVSSCRQYNLDGDVSALTEGVPNSPRPTIMV